MKLFFWIKADIEPVKGSTLLKKNKRTQIRFEFNFKNSNLKFDLTACHWPPETCSHIKATLQHQSNICCWTLSRAIAVLSTIESKRRISRSIHGRINRCKPPFIICLTCSMPLVFAVMICVLITCLLII